jgi:hypothetical protein
MAAWLTGRNDRQTMWTGAGAAPGKALFDLLKVNIRAESRLIAGQF